MSGPDLSSYLLVNRILSRQMKALGMLKSRAGKAPELATN
jgi:hypothetical protein